MSEEVVRKVAAKRGPDPDKRKRIINILTIICIIVIAAIVVILILNATGHGFSGGSSAADGLLEEEGDVIPYGDTASDSYDFTGDYFDMSTLKGTMTITRNAGGYDVSITYTESDDSMTTWTMSATYSKARRALYYTGCVKTEYIYLELAENAAESAAVEAETETVDEADMELPEQTAQISTTESYTDGTGFIYLSNDNIFWIDNKEDMGTGLLFQRVEAAE